MGFPRRHRPPDGVRRPLPALWEKRVFRLLREAAKGAAFGIRGLSKRPAKFLRLAKCCWEGSRAAGTVTLGLLGAPPGTRYGRKVFVFSRLAKCCWEGSRAAGTVTLGLLGAPPLFHVQRNVAGGEAGKLVPPRLGFWVRCRVSGAVMIGLFCMPPENFFATQTCPAYPGESRRNADGR